MLMLLMAAVMIVAAACGNAKESGKTDSQSASEDKKASGSLTISGSSAMQPLVLAAAEKFMEKHPDADVQVQAGVQEQVFRKCLKGQCKSATQMSLLKKKKALMRKP